MTGQPFERFVDAQRESFERAKQELLAGQKQTHWMWYIFPQLRGLGRSETARYFAISNLSEAKSYLSHPVLGPRLEECVSIVLQTHGRTPSQIFGALDAMKFHSSITLFAEAVQGESMYQKAVGVFFGSQGDPETLMILKRLAGEDV